MTLPVSAPVPGEGFRGKRVVCFINRQLGTRIALDIESIPGVDLVALVVHDPGEEDVDLKKFSDRTRVFRWSTFLAWCVEDKPIFDAGVSALFGKIIPTSLLALFSENVVNLHPSLLPHGRGTHPATWAIWEATPYGASAHLMTKDVDCGPLLGQVQIPIEQFDTSATLYARGLDALWNLYLETVKPWILGKATELVPQTPGGSAHFARDLELLYELARDPNLPLEDRKRLLRAITLE